MALTIENSHSDVAGLVFQSRIFRARAGRGRGWISRHRRTGSNLHTPHATARIDFARFPAAPPSSPPRSRPVSARPRPAVFETVKRAPPSPLPFSSGSYPKPSSVYTVFTVISTRVANLKARDLHNPYRVIRTSRSVVFWAKQSGDLEVVRVWGGCKNIKVNPKSKTVWRKTTDKFVKLINFHK